MKKTIVALAVLAASGATFAQATISGKLGFSYQKNAELAGGAANHGMQMADGDLNFAASEDLGGGMSITAKSAFASRGRDTGISARDASLTMITPFGAVALGAVESCSTILNTAGAPVSLSSGHDGGPNSPIDGCANLDYAALVMPVGPVNVRLLYADSIGGAGAGAGAVTANQITASYAAGPLSLGVDHTVFATSVSALTDGLTRTRLWGAYDLGVATIGLGFQNKNHDVVSQTSLSAKVPMGAVTLGLVHSMRGAQSASAAYPTLVAGEARTGTAVGMDYALSKMTTLNASYGVSSESAVRSSEYRLRLLKSF
jgi:predicted porin